MSQSYSDTQIMLNNPYNGGNILIYKDHIYTYNEDTIYQLNIETLQIENYLYIKHEQITGIISGQQNKIYALTKTRNIYSIQVPNLFLTVSTSNQNNPQQLPFSSPITNIFTFNNLSFIYTNDTHLRIYKDDVQIQVLKNLLNLISVTQLTNQKYAVLTREASYIFDYTTKQLSQLQENYSSLIKYQNDLYLAANRNKMIQVIQLSQDNQITVQNELFINELLFDLKILNENQFVGISSENFCVSGEIYGKIENDVYQLAKIELAGTQQDINMKLESEIVNFYQFDDKFIVTSYDNFIALLDSDLNIIKLIKGQHGEIIGIQYLSDQSIIYLCSDDKLYLKPKDQEEKIFQGTKDVFTNLQISNIDDQQFIFVVNKSGIQIYHYISDNKEISHIGELQLQNENQVDSFKVFTSKSAITILYSIKTQLYVIEIMNILQKMIQLNYQNKIQINAQNIAIQLTGHLSDIDNVHMLKNRNIITTALDKSLKLWSYGKVEQKQVKQTQQQIVASIFDIFTGKVDNKINFKLDKHECKIQQIKVIQNITKRQINNIIEDQISNRILICNQDNRLDLYSYNQNDIQKIKSFSCFNKPVRYAQFINDSQQIVALQSDSVYKIINIQNSNVEFVGQCGQWQETNKNKEQNPFEQQQELERLQYLILSAQLIQKDELYSGQIFMGTSSGQIFISEDDTILQQQLHQQEQLKIVMQEQNFLNQLQMKEYSKAICNAIRLYNLRQINNVVDEITIQQINNQLADNFKLEIDFSDFTIQEILQTIRIVEQLSKYNKSVLIASVIFKQLASQIDLNFLNQMNYQDRIQNIKHNLLKAVKRTDKMIGEVETVKLMNN